MYLNRHVFIEAVLTSTHNLCFEHKYGKYQNFLSENFHFLVVKLSMYLNRHVFVMNTSGIMLDKALLTLKLPLTTNVVCFVICL